MATYPYFILGPNTLLSLFGLFYGADETETKAEKEWQDVTVDVVIPAFNEEKTIILCLQSLMRQTLKPHRIVLIDDGSTDKTSAIARAFSAENGIDLEIIRHRTSVGKTPGVKQEAHELDGDVEFILDGDTVLKSENYLERVVQELYKGIGIASACGTIMPLRNNDRDEMASVPEVKRFYDANLDLDYTVDKEGWHHVMHIITDQYREFLYFFLQHFVYRGQMAIFGSIVNPVGCAVAYRREYIKDIFDQYEETLGDNLTTSEDIFIGFALQNMGYHNVQVVDVLAQSQEPEAQSIPGQIFMWSSAFLQSCYYFPELLKSPFKFKQRKKYHKELEEDDRHNAHRKKEAYYETIGVAHTKKYGRPIGWTILLGLLEKIMFPLMILMMITFQWWEALFVTIGCEMAVLLIVTAIISHKYKMNYVGDAILATPMRYVTLMFDLYTVARFVFEITFVKNHEWRK
ncbi:MAG: glycosyl transferase family 2 [Alphaproteobacteria bacterium]|nr:MAG: glycosyl transferase family 2 [Alphaproteobacteria bacterium]